MLQREEQNDSGWMPVIPVAIVGGALILAASKWPALIASPDSSSHLPLAGNENTWPLRPLAELLKMVLAALIGLVVTSVHRRCHRDKPLPRSLLQAQVLLCVAGAMVMVIIGNSVARAFGVVGAAGIVRFRTPVEDPKDTTILFLLVALGMACGVGQLEVAGLGAAFICVVIAVLDRFGDTKARTLILSCVATGGEFPREHVNSVLNSAVEAYEARELAQGDEAVAKFCVVMSPSVSLSWLSSELMANGKAGLKSVAWSEPAKKG